MSSNEWLAGLKPGDLVVRAAGYGSYALALERVSKTTPTQVMVGAEKFRRADGMLVGGGRSMMTVKILQPTPENRGVIRQRRLAGACATTNWQSLPLPILEQINAILELHASGEKAA